MSTRSSSFYKSGLHLYVEQNSGEVCLEGTSINFRDLDWKPKQNEKYGSFTMSDNDWLEFAIAIVKAVSYAKDFK